MTEVSKKSRFETWTRVGALIVLGIAFGAASCRYAVVPDLNQVTDRRDAFQQQLTAISSTANTKPSDGKPAKE